MMEIYQCNKCGILKDSQDDFAHTTIGAICKGQMILVRHPIESLIKGVKSSKRDDLWYFSGAGCVNGVFTVALFRCPLNEDQVWESFSGKPLAAVCTKALEYCKEH